MQTSHSSHAAPNSEACRGVPPLSLVGVFLRFLRFGALAWGGPVAQIGMIRQQLVDDEGWIDRDRFNRVLAVYQVLPGPEAHELCVYFGTLARGRAGGVMAGVGFMLPGFLLMLLLSWLYVRHGLQLDGWSAVFAAVQAAVAALIVRAVFRIGGHVLADRWLWAIAALAMLGQLANVHFAILLVTGGVIFLCANENRQRIANSLLALASVLLVLHIWREGGLGGLQALSGAAADDGRVATAAVAGVPALFWSGLKAGLLTFGGAYTVIPFLQRDAVSQGAWMSNGQFLDGLALSGLLPAPLVIFATFVGYIGGGLWGALAMTAGVFLPAFAFTLLGHDAMERWVHRPRVAEFLAGVTAAVVGLIAGTTLALLLGTVKSPGGALLFCSVLALLFWSKARWLVPAVIVGAGVCGWLAGAISG